MAVRGPAISTRVSDACGSARSNQVERILRQGKLRLSVSIGEQCSRDAMLTDASHRADGLLIVGSSALEDAPNPNETNARSWRSHNRSRYPSYGRATQALSKTPSRGRRQPCCRLATAHNLLTNTSEPCGHRFSGDLPGFKGALPEQGMR